MTNQFCNWPECENVLANEIWDLYRQIHSLEYKLRTIASDTNVPLWIRDYAAGKKDQLQCDGT